MGDERNTSFGGRQLDLGDGTLRLDLPGGWRVSEKRFGAATLLPEAIEHAALRVGVVSYEDPNAVAEDDLGRFLDDEIKTKLAAERLSGAEGIVIRGNWVDAESRSHRRMWKIVKCRYRDHVRVATFILEVPLTEAGARPTEMLSDEIDAMVRGTDFARSVTAMDRIAPTDDMKRVSFWNAIHMRIPAGWSVSREKSDGSGMYCVAPAPGKRDSGSAEAESDEMLWVDVDEFRRRPEAAPLDDGATGRHIIDALAAGILARPEMKMRGAHVEYLDNTDGLLTYVHRSRENGQCLQVRRWFRFAIRGAVMILATFSHVAPDSPDDAESAARRATMFDREIRNAVIGDIGVDGSAPDMKAL